jgi:DNA mismatch endonuclease (patch repair protein)
VDRSANMRAIRSKGMLPELAVRRLAYKMGYRYRLHKKDLPGKPDLVFSSRRKVIFVHGCFWHSHNCKVAHTPKSNLAYWMPKLERNKTRDRRNIEALAANGWQALVVWECEVADERKLKSQLKTFLDGPQAPIDSENYHFSVSRFGKYRS